MGTISIGPSLILIPPLTLLLSHIWLNFYRVSLTTHTRTRDTDNMSASAMRSVLATSHNIYASQKRILRALQSALVAHRRSGRLHGPTYTSMVYTFFKCHSILWTSPFRYLSTCLCLSLPSLHQGASFCWHIDGYDKLSPYGLPIHGCVDGWVQKQKHLKYQQPQLKNYLFQKFIHLTWCLPMYAPTLPYILPTLPYTNIIMECIVSIIHNVYSSFQQFNK